jgi:hypothetical protein
LHNVGRLRTPDTGTLYVLSPELSVQLKREWVAWHPTNNVESEFGAAKELRMGALGSTIKLLGSHADVPSTLVNGMNTVVMSTNPTAATLITVFVIISFTNVR